MFQIVATRFPDLKRQARRKARLMTDPAKITKLGLDISNAPNFETARELLGDIKVPRARRSFNRQSPNNPYYAASSEISTMLISTHSAPQRSHKK